MLKMKKNAHTINYNYIYNNILYKIMRNKKTASDRKTAIETSFYASTKSNNQSKDLKQFEVIGQNKQYDTLLRNLKQTSYKKSQQNILALLEDSAQYKKNLAQCYAETIASKIIKNIESGYIQVSDNRINLDKSKSKQSVEEKPKYLDQEEHKKLIKKLNEQRKNKEKAFRDKSFQIQQKIKQKKQEQQNIKKKELEKELSERKAKIQQKLTKLNILKTQREEQAKISNAEIAKFKNKKSLEQINEEKFKQKFVLPKIEEQKRVLEAIKLSSRTPINFEVIKQHEQIYLKQKQKNVSLKKHYQWGYSPPQFVSKTYLLALEQEKKKNQQKLQKQRQKKELNKRKQQYANKLNQNLKAKFKQQDNKKSQKQSIPVTPQKVNINSSGAPKVKQQKNIDYLEYNKKQAKKKSVSNPKIVDTITQVTQDQKKQNEIQQLNSQRLHLKRKNKIRISNLKSLLANKELSPQERLKLLTLQSQKLDELAKRKIEILKVKGDNSLQHFQTVDILLTSIKTKMQILNEKEKM